MVKARAEVPEHGEEGRLSGIKWCEYSGERRSGRMSCFVITSNRYSGCVSCGEGPWPPDRRTSWI
jgi:hypothetical protein